MEDGKEVAAANADAVFLEPENLFKDFVLSIVSFVLFYS